jgi:hypothetical protein
MKQEFQWHTSKISSPRVQNVDLEDFMGIRIPNPDLVVGHQFLLLAGLPWELGVAETHQTLTLNNLRSRVVLQVIRVFFVLYLRC